MADVGENLLFQLLARVGDVLCVLEGVIKVKL
jgi:membrane protein YqaA with SNARE-associated domain